MISGGLREDHGIEKYAILEKHQIVLEKYQVMLGEVSRCLREVEKYQREISEISDIDLSDNLRKVSGNL